MSTTMTQRQLAAEAWRAFIECAWTRKTNGMGLLKELGLTPGHLKVMILLKEDTAPTMGALAEEMGVHASMATWLIDGLEERGLVERRTGSADRRVKTIVLTKKGAKVKGQLLEAMYEPPAEFLALDRDRLEALIGALGALKAPGSEPPG
jgi:MarR family transcriptional regulator, organic hydroperoxide resistance regulator